MNKTNFPTAFMYLLSAKIAPLHAILSENEPLDPTLVVIGGVVAIAVIAMVFMLVVYLERPNTKK